MASSEFGMSEHNAALVKKFQGNGWALTCSPESQRALSAPRLDVAQYALEALARCAAKEEPSQKTVPLAGLRKISIPLPPLAEQHRIATKVDELMGLCDQLEAQLAITKTESRRLLESVLHHSIEDTQTGTAFPPAMFATQWRYD